MGKVTEGAEPEGDSGRDNEEVCPVQYCYTFGGTCSNVNHVAECWVFKSLNRLCENIAIN
jgi:hypothetical protein